MEEVESKKSYLAASDLFRDLTPEEIEEIDHTTAMQGYKAGHVFYTPGETGEQLFILKKGAVEIYRMSPEGRRLVIAELRPSAFFGDASCIGRRMHERYARATEDTLVCTMRCEDVMRVLLSKPQVALRILEATNRQLLDEEERLTGFVFKSALSRVASLLLREAAEGDEVRGLSHQDIGDRLGIFRETVTNALNHFKAAGVIEVRRMRVRIIDRQLLERAANE